MARKRCWIEVNARAGLTFSRGLRTMLRSDPDVLLVERSTTRRTAADTLPICTSALRSVLRRNGRICGRAAAPQNAAGSQGRDFAPLYLAKEKPAWRTEFFYEHAEIANGAIPASEALVRKDWKYMLWPDKGYEQLFDLASDPQEEKDLARDLQHTARLAEMRALLCNHPCRRCNARSHFSRTGRPARRSSSFSASERFAGTRA